MSTKLRKDTKMARDTSASETLAPYLPIEYRVELGSREVPGAMVTYLPGKGIMPTLPMDADMPHPIMARLIGGTGTNKLDNGLTRRADAMCRLTARGMPNAAAYRAAYAFQGNPARAAARATKIASTGKYGAAERFYRERLEELGRQQALPVRDFVMSRLVLEAQAAKESASRIKALDLLGKSEGMWTTVHRTEKALSPKDAKELKDQLNQRLMAALNRLRPGLVPGPGTTPGPDSGPDGDGSTPPPGDPPFMDRDPHEKIDTIPPIQSFSSPAPIQSSPESPPYGTHDIHARGVFSAVVGPDHREMLEDDL